MTGTGSAETAKLVTHPGLSPPFRVLIHAQAAVIAVAPLVLRALHENPVPLTHPAFLAFLAGACVAGLLFARVSGRILFTPRWVCLGSEQLTVGRGTRVRGRARWSRVDEVTPLDQLGAKLLLVGEAGAPRVAIEFRDAAARAAMADCILERVSSQGDAESRLRSIEQNRRYTLATRLRLSGPWIGFCALLVAIFVVQRATGSFESDVRRYGNVGELVRQGQLYRLVTANLLHAGVAHLAVNVAALLLWSSILPPLLGARDGAVVAVVSGLTGQLAASFASSVTVGASGIVYGAFGAFTFCGLVRWDELPVTYRAGKPLFLIPIAAMLFAEPLIPHLSVAAHLAGFAAGWVTTAWLVRGTTLRQRCLGAA